MLRNAIAAVAMLAAGAGVPRQATAQDKYMIYALDAIESEIAECVAFYSISIERYERASRGDLVAQIKAARAQLVSRHLSVAASRRGQGGKVAKQHQAAMGRLAASLNGTLDNYPELLQSYGMPCRAIVDDFSARMVQLLGEAFRVVD